MLLFTIFDFSYSLYVGDNYKYLGLLLGFSDAKISFYYFLSPVMSMLGNYVVTWSYSRFGLEKTFYLTTLVNTVDVMMVFGSMGFKDLFLWSIFPTRLYANMSQIMNDLVCFNLFRPTTGILYVKHFSLGFLISCLLAIFVNSFVLNPNNVYGAFYIFLVLNLSNLVISFVIFKNYKFAPRKTN